MSANILVVDDTAANLRLLSEALSARGYTVRPAPSGAFALSGVQSFTPDLVLLDVNMPNMDGYEVCRHLKGDERTRDVPVIFISALHETLDKVRAFNAGGVDYVTKPFELEEVFARVETHLNLRRLRRELEQQIALKDQLNETLRQEIETRQVAETRLERARLENDYLQEEIRDRNDSDHIVGSSPNLQTVLAQVSLVAPTESTVLVLGETGTGKELIARAIHEASERSGRPLVKVNCAALPSSLVESELFGHEKGAFTGATNQRIGRFELANGGTIFLDEIGDIGEDVQAKLLRVLQEKEFERVGGSKTIKADVRICAATNRDLLSEVQAGRFREDLYYRLNVFPIHIPPLRARKEDIALLAQHFLSALRKKLRKPTIEISKQSLETLEEYAWPGNVRELQSVIERAVILSYGDTLHIDPALFPKVGQTVASSFVDDIHAAPKQQTETETPLAPINEVIRRQILSALQRTNGVIEGTRGASRILRINAGTLRSRMKKLRIGRFDSDAHEAEAARGFVDATGRLLSLAELEKVHFERVLQHTNGRIEGANGAATTLGLNASTLRSRLRKLPSIK